MGNSSSIGLNISLNNQKGNCKGVLSGTVNLYQHCGKSGWTLSLCPGYFQVANNDFPDDASHITVPTGLRAIIYTGIFNGKSKIISQNEEYNFCSDDYWANDKIRSIIVESVGDDYSQRFNRELDSLNSILTKIHSLGNNPTYQLPQKYKHDIMLKYAHLKKENHVHKEDYILYRRRFLDANPHESVLGIGPFKTLDDRLLLLFWTCYFIFIIPSSHFIINKTISNFYVEKTLTMIWYCSVVVLALLAQACIVLFA